MMTGNGRTGSSDQEDENARSTAIETRRSGRASQGTKHRKLQQNDSPSSTPEIKHSEGVHATAPKDSNRSAYSRNSHALSNLFGLLVDIINASVTLIRRTKIWVWLPAVFLVIKLLCWTMVLCMTTIRETINPICESSVARFILPFCQDANTAGTSVNMELSTSSQDKLGKVMGAVGQNYEVARNMNAGSLVLDLLVIRVEESEIQNKDALASALNELQDRTKETAR